MLWQEKRFFSKAFGEDLDGVSGATRSSWLTPDQRPMKARSKKISGAEFDARAGYLVSLLGDPLATQRWRRSRKRVPQVQEHHIDVRFLGVESCPRVAV